MIEKRLSEINKRKIEIRNLLQSDKEIKLDELKTELESLEKEQNELVEKRSLASSIQTGAIEPNEVKKPENKEERKVAGKETLEQRTKRGEELKQQRAVQVGSSQIILPKHSSDNINPTFNEVSSLLDRVSNKDLPGGESFDQGYEKGTSEAGYTGMGENYSDVETVFDYASITKAKITAYSEEPNEIQKLPAADYDSAIMKGISKSLRKKITRQILIGDGATNHIVGIFSDKAKAIDPSTDKTLTGIDENTLDEIVFSYGGEEDVESSAVLILSKLDLQAFAKVKGADKKRAYDIVLNGNTGTINGIPFIINSVCQPLTSVDTPEGAYSMAYGSLSNYLLATFSPVDVQRSTDYKFKQGQIAHRGEVYIGGNVVAENGFLRIKKGA
ncbi:phage major capsid protein [Bacillus subtilis]|uniref:phage major capsid protein n=1 Tax=Bacillus subtilis TaxID=1423 RepID=UPI0039B390C8